MVEINTVTTPGAVSSGVPDAKAVTSGVRGAEADSAKDVNGVERGQRDEVSREALESSAEDVEAFVNTIGQDTSLSFRVEEDLSRMVVAVRAVGSDEIIRQFPPEEFITVAKFIASQDPGMVDEDFLKGVLFDQYT